MTQHLLVQAEGPPPAIKSAGTNKAVSSDNTEAKPFSSELDKQIDKHVKPQNKSQEVVERSNKTDTTKKHDSDSKAEKADSDDGKNLPKEASANVEKDESGGPVDAKVKTDIAAETEVLKSTTVQMPVTIETKNTTESVNETDIDKESVKQSGVPKQAETAKQKVATAVTTTPEIEPVKQTAVKTQDNSVAAAKATNVDLPLTAKPTAVKQDVVTVKPDSEVKTHIKESSALTDDKKAAKKTTVDVSAQVAVKSQQTGAALKAGNIPQQEIIAVAKGSPQAAVEGLASDQKKQATALRPDILYGINKKYSAKGAKSDFVSATEKVMTSERLVSQAMSEGKLMADVEKPVKSGLKHTTSTTISPSGFVTTHTPMSAVGQGQTVAPVLEIQPAIQTAAWNRVISGRVVWMAREGVQQAELKLNPAKLGPVEVRLNMTNDQTSVTFIASHAATRDALEQALPRLRESFSENGMELADAEVMQHSSEQHDKDDAAETDESGSSSGQASAESDEFSGDEQPTNNEQEELDVGLSLYA